MSLASRPRSPGPSSSLVGEAWRSCRTHLRYAMGFSAVINIAYLAPTLFMLGVYDMVVPSGSGSTLVFFVIALGGTLLIQTLLERVRASLLLSASLRLDKIVSPRLLASAFRSEGPGPRLGLSSSLREFDRIRAAATGPAALALFDAPWIFIYIAVCFCLHPAIGWLALASTALLLVLAVWNERATRRLSEQTVLAGADCAVLQESAGASADVVRALGMSRTMLARLQAARRLASIPTARAGRINGDISGSIRFLRLLLQSSALALGAWLAINRQISAGSIFAASMLAGRALAPIDAIVAQWRTMSQAIAAYRVIAQRAVEAPVAPLTLLPSPKPRLTVRQLAVAAPAGDRLVLSEVTFGSEGGEIIGVLGASGAGKTTLLQVLANARAPLQGDLRLDGARYNDYDPDRLGRSIGYVPQDSVLFPGTVTDNISRFDTAAGADAAAISEKVIFAARRAGVHDMILRLPLGYDTPLGPRGEGLSAGQRQRLALARAIYDDPGVYVLDEPNASLDAEGETRLMQTLEDLRTRGALVILSVHRPGLAAMADKLLILNGGRMERFGPRQEVLDGLKAQERPRQPGPERPFSSPSAAVGGFVQIVGAAGA